MAIATHTPAVLCRTRIPLMSMVKSHGHSTAVFARIPAVSSGYSSVFFTGGQRVVSVELRRRLFSSGRKSGIVGLRNVGKSTLFKALVVRCFKDNDIVHVNGKVDPEVDIDIINQELASADMSQIEKRIERLKKGRAKDPQAKEEVEIAALQRINEALLNGKPARMVPLNEEESKVVEQLCLLTMKPVSQYAVKKGKDIRTEVVGTAESMYSSVVAIFRQPVVRRSFFGFLFFYAFSVVWAARIMFFDKKAEEQRERFGRELRLQKLREGAESAPSVRDSPDYAQVKVNGRKMPSAGDEEFVDKVRKIQDMARAVRASENEVFSPSKSGFVSISGKGPAAPESEKQQSSVPPTRKVLLKTKKPGKSVPVRTRDGSVNKLSARLEKENNGVAADEQAKLVHDPEPSVTAEPSIPVIAIEADQTKNVDAVESQGSAIDAADSIAARSSELQLPPKVDAGTSLNGAAKSLNGSAKVFTEGKSAPSTSGEVKVPSNGKPAPPTSGETKVPSNGKPTPSTSGEAKVPSNGKPASPISGEAKVPINAKPTQSTSGETKVPSNGKPASPTSGEAKVLSNGKPAPSTSGEAKASNGNAAASSNGATKPVRPVVPQAQKFKSMRVITSPEEARARLAAKKAKEGTSSAKTSPARPKLSRVSLPPLESVASDSEEPEPSGQTEPKKKDKDSVSAADSQTSKDNKVDSKSSPSQEKTKDPKRAKEEEEEEAWMRDEVLRNIVLKVRDNEEAGRESFDGLDSEEEQKFFRGLERKFDREGETVKDWIQARVENLDYGVGGIGVDDPPESFMARLKDQDDPEKAKRFAKFQEDRKQILEKQMGISMPTPMDPSPEDRTSTSSPPTAETSSKKERLQSNGNASGSKTVVTSSGKKPKPVPQEWQHTKKWAEELQQKYDLEGDPEQRKLISEVGQDLDRWITEEEIEEASRLLSQGLPGEQEYVKMHYERTREKIKKQHEMFGSAGMLNKYAEYKEEKKEPELWWLDLPYVLCIGLTTKPTEDDEGGRSGFYSLDMTPDFAGARQGPTRTYNHTVAFQDQKDALNFCALLMSEQYSANVVPIPPKDLYQDAKQEGFKVTVIKQGQLGLVPGQALDDVENRVIEIGSSIYWEELERERSIDIDAVLDEGLGYGRPSR